MTSVDLATTPVAGTGPALRPMRAGDVPPVVRLHQAAFPSSFMTTFGSRFLSAFYAGLIAHPDGYGCVLVDAAGRPLGFCVGGTGVAQGLGRDLLLRRPLSFLWPAALSVLGSPRRLGRVLVVARSYLGRREQSGTTARMALLMQIAVTEELRGTGAAERLVEDFLAEMRRRGATTVRLGVEQGNLRAIAFYRQMGFQEVREGVFERHLMESPHP